MSKTICVVLCFLLSGCVIYTPSYNSQQATVRYQFTSVADDHTATTTTTKEVSERVVPKVPHLSAQRPLAECEPFTLPRATPTPPRPSNDVLDGATSSDELDKLLGAYVKALRTYIDSERAKIEQAHHEWLAHCQQK